MRSTKYPKDLPRSFVKLFHSSKLSFSVISSYHRPAIRIITLFNPLLDTRLNFVSGPSAFFLRNNACHFDYKMRFTLISLKNFTLAIFWLFNLYIKSKIFWQTAWHISFGVCKRQGHIHRSLLTNDYYEFRRHEGELQPSIWTEIDVMGLASPLGVASHWIYHCRARVAQGIRAMPPNVDHTFLSVTTAVCIMFSFR